MIVILSSGKEKTLETLEKYIDRAQIPDYLGGGMVTRPRAKESGAEMFGPAGPQRRSEQGEAKQDEDADYDGSDGWVEGWSQQPGDARPVYRATIAQGGVVPTRYHKHKEGKACLARTMKLGDPTLAKYHKAF